MLRSAKPLDAWLRKAWLMLDHCRLKRQHLEAEKVKHRLPSAVAEFSRQAEPALKAVVGKLAFHNH
jgi:hypothetical protein